jgi:hypothetical protein
VHVVGQDVDEADLRRPRGADPLGGEQQVAGPA